MHGIRESVNLGFVIASFGDKQTEEFFHGRTHKVAWQSVDAVAHRKLDMVNAAHQLDDLKSPPGNRLEALQGDLKGWHSIRINQQFRVIFRWQQNAAHEVKITDYH